MRTFHIAIVLLIAALSSQATAGESAEPTKASQPQITEAELLYQDDFNKDLSQWVVEQSTGGSTKIVDGKLDIDDGAGPHDKGGCTVWFRQKLSGPIVIEYNATLIQQGGPNDRVSDLNCFWMATDPAHPGNFFAASKERGGNFKNYDALKLYYVGYGANGNVTTRFRRYPRSRDDKGLAPQYDLSGAQYMNTPNKTLKIRILADGEKIRFYRDGEIIFDFTDKEPLREGWFGFRTVRSHMRIDHFRVYRPAL